MLLTACGDPSISAPEDTGGTLPDGRKIKCITRNMGAMESNHYIYFIENPDHQGYTVTSNHTEGKSGNQVEVTIDGVRYVPLEVQPK